MCVIREWDRDYRVNISDSHRFHCRTAHASQHMIGWELSCTCIAMHRNVWLAERPRPPALWRHGRNFSFKTWCSCRSFVWHVYAKKFDIKTQFFVVDALSFIIKPHSPKLHFYHLNKNDAIAVVAIAEVSPVVGGCYIWNCKCWCNYS